MATQSTPKKAGFPILPLALVGGVLFLGGSQVANAVRELDITLYTAKFDKRDINLAQARGTVSLMIDNPNINKLQGTAITGRIYLGTKLAGYINVRREFTIRPQDQSMLIVPILLNTSVIIGAGVDVLGDALVNLIKVLREGGSVSQILKLPDVRIEGRVFTGSTGWPFTQTIPLKAV